MNILERYCRTAVARRVSALLAAVKAPTLRSAFRVVAIRVTHPDVSIGLDCRIGAGVKIIASAGSSIELRSVTVAAGATIDAAAGATIRIGEGTFIGPGAIVAAKSRVTIGAGCQIADYVTVRDHDHVHQDGTLLAELNFTVAPIAIGDDVWLASKATVTAGVTIGEHALVAAGAVVVRDVDASTTVGGVPARVLVRPPRPT